MSYDILAAFSRIHVGDSEASWMKALWSDETKIELFGPQTIWHIWCKPKNTAPAVKRVGGSSIML